MGVCAINAQHPQPLIMFIRIVAVVMFAAILASCRRGEADTGPTLQPTLTSTPRSTALPPVNTPLPPASEGNPLVVLFSGSVGATRGGVNTNGEALEAALLASELNVRVQYVPNGADALQAVCNSPANPVTIAWVDAVTYSAIKAQNCGDAALLIERDVNGTAALGAEVNIIVNSRAEISSITDLAGATFCRLGVSDLHTWIVPSLMMSASRLSPVDLGEIEDFGSLGELVDAVARGTCDAAAISSTDLQDIGRPNSVRVLNPPLLVPYAVLVMPPAVPLGLREQVLTNLTTITGDAEQAEALSALLRQTNFVAVEEDTLEGWDQFIRTTRLNFATMGQ